MQYRIWVKLKLLLACIQIFKKNLKKKSVEEDVGEKIRPDHDLQFDKK